MRKKMANRKILFVSSVQKEFNAERRAIKILILSTTRQPKN